FSEQTIKNFELNSVGEFFKLNGISDFAQLEFNDSLVLLDSLTIEALVRVDNFSNRPCGFMDGSINPVISQAHSGSWAGNYTLGLSQAGVFFMFEPIDSHYVVSCRIEAGKWYHIAVSHTFGNGAETKFYINGEEMDGFWVDDSRNPIDGNYIPNPLQSRNPYLIGSMGPTHPVFFHGGIDELRIWNRVLSSEEIAGRIQKPLTGKESGLISEFTFD
ncbi:MAG: LamG domain-containing protein, partial [Spirochaetota bacterium]|nr:LamG domain-containing protein [Spirochaetota bacterium]